MSKTHHTGEQYRPELRRRPNPARLSCRETEDLDTLLDVHELLADDWRELATDTEWYPS